MHAIIRAMTVSTSALDQLRRTFRGDVITAGDGSYDDARRLWNGIHDRRPAVILRPSDAAEVATAIRFGREQDLEIQVRSGGHAKAGLRGRDGGLVIDMTAMRGVEVDPRARIARVNGGALLGELDVAAQAHGLVTPVGVVGHTGVAGLTLGGGVGPPPAPLRPHDRQPRRGRARHRRRPPGPGVRDRGAGAVLGPARRRLELRGRDGLRVPAPSVRPRPPPRRS